jgi:hypothetical protein
VSVSATSGDGRTELGLALLSRTPRNTCSVKKVGVLLGLFFLESWLNVYAGKVDMRPPAAPTRGVSCGLERREERFGGGVEVLQISPGSVS